MWLTERYDWSRLRAMESAAGVPAAIQALCCAESKTQSDEAYWKIDNVVVVQGRLFEAALPTAVCLTSSLRICSSVSLSNVLELLVQLGSGVPDPSETRHGHSDLTQLCQRELTREFGSFVSILEESVLSNRGDDVQHSVDLMLLCALGDESLRDRVIWLYEKAVSSGKVDEALEDLIQKSMAVLRQPTS
jgi:hypothetical protein